MEQINALSAALEIEFLIHNLLTDSQQHNVADNSASNNHHKNNNNPALLGPDLISHSYYHSSIQLAQFLNKTILSLYLHHFKSYRPHHPHRQTFLDEISPNSFHRFQSQYLSGLQHLQRRFDSSLSVPPKLYNNAILYNCLNTLHNVLVHQSNSTIDSLRHNNIAHIHSKLERDLARINPTSDADHQSDRSDELHPTHISPLIEHNIHIHSLNMPVIMFGANFLRNTDKDKQQLTNYTPSNDDDLPCVPPYTEHSLVTSFEHFVIQQNVGSDCINSIQTL
jgi:hypothetical protein